MGEPDYMVGFRKAFVEKKADYVALDGWSGEYLRKGIDWGLKEKIIYYDPKVISADEQYSFWAYRLTEKGRRLLGID